jgi:ATP-dependent Clp protease ATP-binding subunit ClpC
VTAGVVIVALVAGLAGGAAAAVVTGAIQAWMARPKSTDTGAGWVARVSRAPAEQPSASTGIGPFGRFTDRGKRVFALAQDEAIRHNHNYIGTEHLLAALLRDADSVAARALTALGIELAKVRTALDFIVGRGDQPTSPTEITLSPRTKKVIELASDEARKLGHSHAGAEHILLGLVREGEGIASGILESLGASRERVRAKVLELLRESDLP